MLPVIVVITPHTSERKAFVLSVIAVITPHTSERKAYVLSVIVVITPHTSERKAYVLFVIVVITPHTSERKAFVLSVMFVSAPVLREGTLSTVQLIIAGNGSAIPFKRPRVFSHTLCHYFEIPIRKTKTVAGIFTHPGFAYGKTRVCHIYRNPDMKTRVYNTPGIIQVSFSRYTL